MNKHSLKKLICLLLVGMIGSSYACGSSSSDGGNNDSGSSTQSGLPGYTAESYSFAPIYTDGDTVNLNAYNPNFPEENGNVVYDVYSNIGNKNYLKMEIETDVNLVGYINYYSNEDPSVINSEKFYIEANDTEFTTFLDAYRVGARGAFDKTISTISFQNVDDTKDGTFKFKSLGISDRKIVTKEDMYITDGATVLGTSPYYGGCISYLERTDADIYEYMDSDGNICVDRDVDPDFVYQVSKERVNLVNICDLGREIQPSYYSLVQEENGYKPDYDPEDKDSYYQGLTNGKPIYNPIQCGDYGGHTPQIIDYVYKEDYLYIKMKGQEWFFFTNIQANGYIEVTYYFKDGALVVDNRYTDFSQFINLEDVAVSSQETPATYFVYPLNYFYCETRQGTIFDKNISAQNGRSQERTSPRGEVSGEYFYALKGRNVIDGWCAFVNENKFGVGILMPNADRYIASRGQISTNYFNETENTRYYKEFFQFDESEIIPSYATFNYSYINPAIIRKMVNFVPLEYSYALYVGDVEEMRDVFGGLQDGGVVTNENLKSDEGWPRK
ncbi:MAG: hypothetical protein IJD77_00440 [Clostridia bacterium]|nr:hypothetical protein [Clostridia bacterium]